MTENDTITFDTIDGRTNIAVQEIESMTDMFDNRDYPEIPCAGRTLISWGQANDLPYGLINTISSDEVMSANKLFNVQCLYGMGLQYCDISTRQPSRDPEVRRFVSRNNFPHLFLEQATDMKYFYFARGCITSRPATSALKRPTAVAASAMSSMPTGRTPRSPPLTWSAYLCSTPMTLPETSWRVQGARLTPRLERDMTAAGLNSPSSPSSPLPATAITPTPTTQRMSPTSA